MQIDVEPDSTTVPKKNVPLVCTGTLGRYSYRSLIVPNDPQSVVQLVRRDEKVEVAETPESRSPVALGNTGSLQKGGPYPGFMKFGEQANEMSFHDSLASQLTSPYGADEIVGGMGGENPDQAMTLSKLDQPGANMEADRRVLTGGQVEESSTDRVAPGPRPVLG